jgi:alkanesulfonate monooxygenase SsuD/methylene tetrahydromethanopterin reductase-like flavin-dependent oxidoreductase (luciferase family)
VIKLGVMAERRGWSGFWVSEVLSLDAGVLLGALAMNTTRMRLGTSIVPATTRSAALLAMFASTVAQLAPGRFSLGIGVSTPAIVTERHDRPADPPAATAAGVLDVLIRALSGERVERATLPHVSNLRIAPLGQRPPVLLAALGPRMRRIAVESADGLILNLVPLGEAARVAAAAHRERGEGYETLISQRICVDPTDDDVHSLRREIASYCRVPAYAANFARLDIDVGGILAADPAEAGDAVSSDLLNELVILGSADECRSRVGEFVAAGVTPLLAPVGAAARTANLIDRLSTD